MAKSPMYDPQTSEARSPWLAGLTEICNKLSGVLNMETQTFEDLTLPELYISSDDRYRIYQAPLGNKLWLQTPAPVFKKNGVVITPSTDGFEVDYLGGSIVFSDEKAKENLSTDIFTASATYIVDTSQTISNIFTQLTELTAKTGNYKGSFDTLNDLNSAVPTATAGDYAVVQDESTIYIWNNVENKWKDVYKEIDLSAYLTAEQIQALLDTKEDTIAPYSGSSVLASTYFFNGKKQWSNIQTSVRATNLSSAIESDISEENAVPIDKNDSILSGFGKLQSQINTFIHPLSGTGDPTTETVGKIGQDYINTSNGKKYHLVSIENADTTPSYIWEEYGANIAAGTGIAIANTSEGKKEISLSEGILTTITDTSDLASSADTKASNALQDAASKVSKGGDQMTGDLTVIANIGVIGNNHTIAVINDAGDKSVGIKFNESRFDADDNKTYVAGLVTNDGSDALLTGLATPTEGSDAVNKAYVDDSIQSAILDSWSASY